MKVAQRAAVPPFQVMSILDRVAQLRAEGRDVISLCAGEPSGGAPADVVAAAKAAHEANDLGYTSALGPQELRAAIAGHYQRWYALPVTAEDVAVTTGSSGAFLLAFLAAFDPGDRVALASPGYPAYRNILTALGCQVVDIPCGPAQRFQPTPELLAAAHDQAPLAGLVVASPANPTGTMIPREELAALTAWCDAHGVRLISDEIYHGITYPGPTGTGNARPGEVGGPDGAGARANAGAPESAGTAGDSARTGLDGGPEGWSEPSAEEEPALQDVTARGVSAWESSRTGCVVSSFSKYWGMTGWRLGWMLMPEDLRPSIDALAGNIALCPPAPAARAALAAFTDSSYAEADARVASFARTRARLLERVPELGWGSIAPADGAFYLYADLADALGPHPDSVSWCRGLLEEQGVAAVPGVDFDPGSGNRFVRLSFAAGSDAVESAVERIAAFQAGLAR